MGVGIPVMRGIDTGFSIVSFQQLRRCEAIFQRCVFEAEELYGAVHGFAFYGAEVWMRECGGSHDGRGNWIRIKKWRDSFGRNKKQTLDTSTAIGTVSAIYANVGGTQTNTQICSGPFKVFCSNRAGS